MINVSWCFHTFPLPSQSVLTPLCVLGKLLSGLRGTQHCFIHGGKAWLYFRNSFRRELLHNNEVQPRLTDGSCHTNRLLLSLSLSLFVLQNPRGHHVFLHSCLLCLHQYLSLSWSFTSSLHRISPDISASTTSIFPQYQHLLCFRTTCPPYLSPSLPPPPIHAVVIEGNRQGQVTWPRRHTSPANHRLTCCAT